MCVCLWGLHRATPYRRDRLILKYSFDRKIQVQLGPDFLGTAWGWGRGWGSDPAREIQGLTPNMSAGHGGQCVVVCKAPPPLVSHSVLGLGLPAAQVGDLQVLHCMDGGQGWAVKGWLRATAGDRNWSTKLGIQAASSPGPSPPTPVISQVQLVREGPSVP